MDTSSSPIKAMARRWRFTAPMLLIVVALAPLIFGAMPPSYTSTSFVQMIPPLPRPESDDPNVAPPPVNPWVRQGLQTIANAAIVTVMDKSVAEQMKAAGYSDDFTVELDMFTPMVKIEVNSKSREQARSTAEEIVRRLSDNLVQLQSQYGLTAGELISAKRLDAGNNIEKSYTKAIAVTLFVVMVWSFATAGVAVLVDRAVNRRRRSGADADGEPAKPGTYRGGAAAKAVTAKAQDSQFELPQAAVTKPNKMIGSSSTATTPAPRADSVADDSHTSTVILAPDLNPETTMVLPRIGKRISKD